MTSSTIYCACETPVMDVEHDAGCRRCGRPVDFSPKRAAGLEEIARAIGEADELEEPCPVVRHAHDCDCRRDASGRWLIDPACTVKRARR